MSLANILKACAIVGLSAVTMISTVLKVKEEQNGSANQNVPAFNNGNPYNCNTGEMNMYNNNAYGSQSRRFYGCAQPSYPMANGPMMMGPYQQPMRPLTFGSPIPQPSAQLQMALAQNGYSVPCYNSAYAYQGGYNAPQQQYGYTPSGYSRRNMMPNGMYQQQPQQNPYSNQYMWQNMTTGVYREPTYSQYGYGYDNGVSALYSGSSYNYGYSDDYGYGNYQQQQQTNNYYGYQQNQQPQVQTLGSFNSSIIGSAARYRFWSPETSGSSYTYYGYDDNTPSYPSSAPQQQRPMMQQPMMNNYGYQQPPMMQPQMTPPPPQQPQYSDEQMKLFEEIERFKQSEAARANAMRQSRMNDPMDGRLHNTIRPINTENAWYSRSEMPSPQQSVPNDVIIAPTPPFMQNGPAEMQQPNPPKSVGGSSVTFDAMISNGIHQPDPNGPQSPDDMPVPDTVMQFGDNWVPVDQQPEAYSQQQPLQQPQQSVGVQPLYTMPEEPQPQQQPVRKIKQAPCIMV